MGRILLCGKEAQNPYVVEDLDLKIGSAEELCYYIYHNVALLPDGFFDERMVNFIGEELGMQETAEKIRRFCHSTADEDNTLFMLLSENGFYSADEMEDFRERLALKRRKIGPEKTMDRGDALVFQKRYQSALRSYRSLKNDRKDARITDEFYVGVLISMADCYGRLGEFEKAYESLVLAYEDTHSEEILRKMYEVSEIAGFDFPDVYRNRVSAETMRRWEQGYRLRETLAREKIAEQPVMEVFLHEEERAKEELSEFVRREKELFRKMLE